ncbi:hypothetical protein TTHERM_000571989 (macronuclear) [Tetrahymena thermophila SB210]|uniref:Uncharacterized protein n=1 Tax=Tetrahymena thermophila (strain SB210) TaxID=312017 RepID=W7X7B2_TETTS|nr:hypothetical protein TTHERM_000571989 [Tetrahymena thermophila SB210]EWS72273.1 hypothetical protein TTHERM_000571989 [Tetrahymena thermophila SB210]|eukprot:XP_012655213.1 hypothetical protein TTHERM_000571989 [Tetrahymena thermophila SB210]
MRKQIFELTQISDHSALKLIQYYFNQFYTIYQLILQYNTHSKQVIYNLNQMTDQEIRLLLFKLFKTFILNVNYRKVQYIRRRRRRQYQKIVNIIFHMSKFQIKFLEIILK